MSSYLEERIGKCIAVFDDALTYVILYYITSEPNSCRDSCRKEFSLCDA